MQIAGTNFILREWRREDQRSLVQHGNNRKVWINLTDAFPHPYTREDAMYWIESCIENDGPQQNFAIVAEDRAVGGIGVHPRSDVHRGTAIIGYWLGEAVWGRGIATEACGLMTEYAFKAFDVRKLLATVFSWNPASARVLTKNGYAFEARLRGNIVKDGRVCDELIYGRLKC